jgi:hypothetical protein
MRAVDVQSRAVRSSLCALIAGRPADERRVCQFFLSYGAAANEEPRHEPVGLVSRSFLLRGVCTCCDSLFKCRASRLCREAIKVFSSAQMLQHQRETDITYVSVCKKPRLPHPFADSWSMKHSDFKGNSARERKSNKIILKKIRM